MNKLVAIVYPNITTAVEVQKTLEQLQTEQLIDMEDVVHATRDAKGKIKLHHKGSSTGEGAAVGSLWGLLIGMLFLSPLFGLVVGAGTGAIAGSLSDYGIDDNFIKSLGDKMQPNTSAIFVSVRSAVADKVVPEIAKYGGELLQTSLSEDTEKRLQAELDKGGAKTGQHAHA